MESMKSGSANHSHHPNKVAINSLETDSNKQTITSNVSGSTLNNNNKSSGNNQQQQQQQSATESKENNFEYDDNEWDVGGIGDLIKDLDNDIKKTSETVSQNVNTQSEQSSSSSSNSSISSSSGSGSASASSSNSRSSSSSPSSLSTPSSTSAVSAQLNQQQQQSQSIGSSTIQSNRLIEHDTTKSKKDSLSDTDKSGKTKNAQASTSSTIDKSQAKNQSISSSKPTSAPHQLNKQKISTLSDQESGKKLTQKSTSTSNTATELIGLDKNSTLNIGNMSSNTTGQTTGKAGNKVADHHATLDKGLKMKIKRTKPGTKTSEAKHEIVKAEQNGSLSGADDINPLNTSNSGSGNKKVSLQQQNQPTSGLPQSQSNLNQSQTNSSSSQQLSSSPALTSTPNTSQTNKRTNSSHRRDKTRDKTSYSQRDKASSNNSSTAVNNSSNLNNSDIHNSSASNSDRNYNCHDLNTSLSAAAAAAVTTAATPSKVEHDSLGASIDNGISQRISSAPLQTCANNPSNSNVISSALNSTSANTFGSTTNMSVAISSSKTPNAPGPPQIDGKLSYSTTIISHIQQQSQLINFQSNNISATLNSQPKSSSSLKLSNAPVSPQIDSKMGILSNGEESTSPPPTKKIKCESKDMVDVCVGTSVGTITEPDCLGPCEPGTSVTLEGIVWHETEGGVLVVNVTWRGKTYVGTLLDCTKHDWAPPRFCDSPTEELDSRTPKGRAKRGRSAAQQPTNDLSNFTETRSSVHSKLRNASAKGRASRTSTSSTTNTTNTTTTITASSTSINPTNSSSITASPPDSFLPTNARRAEKRKSKDDSPPPSFNGSDSNGSNSGSATNSDLNVQIPKKVKTTTPCAISPVLLECPEQDCSKKYKHANGLKYHQSHAHGAGSMDEDSQQLPESPRDSQQLPESPPPLPKHAAAIHSSPLPSSRSSFESIVASGFSEITPTPPPAQPEQANDTASVVEPTNVSINVAQPPVSVQRSRTPTPSLETKPSSVPITAIQESNQTSPTTTSEPSALPLVGQSQPANNNSVQTPKNESQTKASTPGPQPVSMVKTQKKQRKEGTNDFENTSRDRDDVQSPAYSDISDDSTPVAESEISGMFKDKNQAVKHPADILPKKVGETLPPQSSQMGYGIYHFCEFPQAQPAASAPAPEHANGKQTTPQPVPTSIPGSIQDYKAPVTASVTTPVTTPEITSRSMHPHPGAPPVMSQSKFLGNYYPYNYMPPGYPYNIDPNYGPVSMVSDDGKLPAPQPMIKEERLKESPSPNENPKSQLQNLPVKMVKTEPGVGKDLKQPQPLPPPHENHPKDLNASPIGPYSSMFQRQPLNVPQPQHMREEELRRYYGMYPDQRRPGAPGSSLPQNMPQNIKEEPQSPSQPSSQGQSHRDRDREREKDRNDHSQPQNLKSSGHSTPQQQKQQPKDSKNEDKEPPKPKQDIGQKPSFESQGPPPPPTSQFYAIHPPYMSPGPFGFEPSMYRNMMVPYNSSPYHLQMSRFHAPEDLSRNTNSKALDILQHQAAQYAYNTHKIHELSERALKSPTSINSNNQSQHPASQPPVSQQSAQQPPNSMNPNVPSSGPMPGHANLQTPPTSMPPTTGAKSGPPSSSQPTNLSGTGGDLPPNKDGSSSERSPPPAMRHIHTHHHTHVGVGLGYPMYPAAYSAAVLTPQQAAVAVINPFPPGPNK